MTQPHSGGYLTRPNPSGLADVVEIILDKGLVIDAYVRVSLVGIEVLTIDARVVISSVDTYLRFAEATNRLDLADKGGRTLVDIVTQGAGEVIEDVASNVVEDKVDHALDTVGDTIGEPAEKVARGAARKVLEVGEEVASKPRDGSAETY